jgi:hypothetical protein
MLEVIDFFFLFGILPQKVLLGVFSIIQLLLLLTMDSGLEELHLGFFFLVFDAVLKDR